VAEDRDSADVRSVLEGNISAFENIVRRWQKPLINLAFRFCRNRHRAEEMVQDAFIQIYRKLDQFRGKSTFSTWLFAISLNSFRASLRRKSFPIESLDAVAEIADKHFPYLLIEQRERDALVRRAVAALPPKYRDAVVLYYFKEMNLTESAQILDVSEGTLKARLHRAREIIGRKLGSSMAPAAMVEEVHS
jgi:RNA polymerase sigma-70 factor (ECF subfamily)